MRKCVKYRVERRDKILARHKRLFMLSIKYFEKQPYILADHIQKLTYQTERALNKIGFTLYWDVIMSDNVHEESND